MSYVLQNQSSSYQPTQHNPQNLLVVGASWCALLATSSLMILMKAVSSVDLPTVNSGNPFSMERISNMSATEVMPPWVFVPIGTSKRVATSSTIRAPGILDIAVCTRSISAWEGQEKWTSYEALRDSSSSGVPTAAQQVLSEYLPSLEFAYTYLTFAST